MRGIDGAYILIIIIYSLFMLFLGGWALFSIPGNCPEGKLQSKVRGLLMVSVITITVAVCYGLCELKCYNENVEDQISLAMMIFILSISIAEMVLLSVVKNAFGKSTVCSTKSTTTLKRLMNWGIGASILIMIVTIISIGIRMNEISKESRAAKERILTKYKTLKAQKRTKLSKSKLKTIYDDDANRKKLEEAEAEAAALEAKLKEEEEARQAALKAKKINSSDSKNNGKNDNKNNREKNDESDNESDDESDNESDDESDDESDKKSNKAPPALINLVNARKKNSKD